MTNNIIKKNLELFTSREPGGFHYARKNNPESIGGNASDWNGYTCEALFFHADTVQGLLRYFGLPQGTPRQIRDCFSEGYFKIVSITGSPQYRKLSQEEQQQIGEEITRCGGAERLVVLGTPQGSTAVAQENLEATVNAWNTQYGFQFDNRGQAIMPVPRERYIIKKPGRLVPPVPKFTEHPLQWLKYQLELD